MKTDLGKKWEEVFKQNWKKCFPNTFVFRLKDQMTGYKETSGNPCDFLCFTGRNLFMVECKEHEGASIPFSVIPQYERLLDYKGISRVKPGILIWFSEKDTVIWVPIETAEKIYTNGEKSIGLRLLDQKDKFGNKLYNIIVLPAEKKRVFMDVDYNYLEQMVGENIDE